MPDLILSFMVPSRLPISRRTGRQSSQDSPRNHSVSIFQRCEIASQWRHSHFMWPKIRQNRIKQHLHSGYNVSGYRCAWRRKRWVIAMRSKMSLEWDSLILGGNELNTVGSATENARPANSVRTSEERRQRASVWPVSQNGIAPAKIRRLAKWTLLGRSTKRLNFRRPVSVFCFHNNNARWWRNHRSPAGIAVCSCQVR